MGIFGWLKRFIGNRQLSHQPVDTVDIPAVETVLGYRFTDRLLLVQSLKHRSYSQEVDGDVELSNERLEFLGDSVLNLIISHHLFVTNPALQEGELTKQKSTLVSKSAAFIAGRAIGIDRFLLLSGAEEESGGRNRDSIIADTYEAIVGAIFLDGGLQAARNFISRSILINEGQVLEEVQTNYKSLILELSQAHKLGHPVYKTVSEEGPDHEKIFTVEVLIRGETYGTGVGKSKKSAQQMAAHEGLNYLLEKIKTMYYIRGFNA